MNEQEFIQQYLIHNYREHYHNQGTLSVQENRDRAINDAKAIYARIESLRERG